jgi:acyl-ACP thioesterase
MLKHPSSIYDFSIKSYDSDQTGKLTLHTLFHFLQECAWDNARLNDFGFEFLESKNAYWVLSRILVQMDEYPNWRDDIKIKTWPKGTHGFFALRDFEVYKNDKVIGRVTTSWLILNKDSKRPQRLDQFNFVQEDFIHDHAINKNLDKIGIPRELEKVTERKVYYSDLDVNKHVNNATYVRWILDSYFSDSEKEITEFEINFLSELYLNDHFTVHKAIAEQEHFYILKNLKDREVCRVRIK